MDRCNADFPCCVVLEPNECHGDCGVDEDCDRVQLEKLWGFHVFGWEEGETNSVEKSTSRYLF